MANWRNPADFGASAAASSPTTGPFEQLLGKFSGEIDAGIPVTSYELFSAGDPSDTTDTTRCVPSFAGRLLFARRIRVVARYLTKCSAVEVYLNRG